MRALRLLLVFAVSAWTAAAAPASADEAEDFIRQTGERAIATLSGKDLTDAERESRFRAIFRDAFDVKAIARFAVGRYWRLMSPEQRTEYVRLFEDFVVKVYARRFEEYETYRFDVTQSRALDGHDHLVLSEIRVPQQAPVRVNWRVSNNDGSLRIEDVIIEGVSMSITQRDEFTAVIRNGGGKVEALLDALRRKVGAG